MPINYICPLMTPATEKVHKTGLKKCVFFDRDGIVNRSPGAGFVERLEDFHILPEFKTALQVARERGYEAVIVTNQRAVGLGRMTAETLQEIHSHLRKELGRHGLHLLDVVSCVATDDQHPHRKPNPGMILEAAGKYHLDLPRSWVVGDQERDVVAGKRAGCRTVLVRPGDEPTVADHRIACMQELAEFLSVHL
jgi:D-glycero-D-manno-heptose 1,7-bisphosphate phosphatase